MKAQWGQESHPEQVKDVGALLLPRTKENEKASWKALGDQGPAI